MVADDDARHTGADRLDDTCTLVAEHRRAARLGGTVDRVEIGMADAARTEAHQHLTRLRRVEIELLHLVGPAGRLEHGGTNLHGAAAVDTDGCPAACSARNSSSGM